MRNLFYALIFLITIISCNSPQKALDEGNYDKAISDLSISLKKNAGNDSKKLLLQEAFNKATQRDLEEIERLKQTVDQNPENWTKIYDVYDRMEIREITVIPLLPLRANGKVLELNIPDIENQAESAKADASKALYTRATRLLALNDKLKAREAYATLDELVEFNHNYRDAKELREKAKIKGSTNIYVQMVNNTRKDLPASFKSDLLTFRENSFTDPWINYSTQKSSSIPYDYQIDLEIDNISIGRNNEQSRQFREQQNVVVGYRNVKDSKGNTVKQPQYQTVYADILEVLQSKPIEVAGTVVYKKYNTTQELASIPVQRKEAWQNNYAQFRGDERALSNETIAKIKNGKQQFPSDKDFLDASGKLLNQAIVKLFEENASNLK